MLKFGFARYSYIILPTMAVSIERCYMVSFDNSPTWKVSKDKVKTVNGDDFVRLRPYDTSFVRMVMDSQLPKGTKKVSLAATEGFRSLVKLRNDSLFSPKDDSPDKSDGADDGLFAADVNEKEPKRKVRFNAAKLQELRRSPERMELEVPSTDGSDPLVISALKPLHPCEDVWVQLEDRAERDKAVVPFVHHCTRIVTVYLP